MAHSIESITQRLTALGPLPEFPGEREWVDRLRTPEDFAELGPMVADDFRALRARTKDWNPAKAEHAAREFERRKAMCPPLFALLFEAFPPVP
jgi:hypothetical protein